MRTPKGMKTVVAAGLALITVWTATIGAATPRTRGIGRYTADALIVNVLVTYLAILAAYVVVGGPAWKKHAARVVLNLGTLALLAAAIELPALAGLVDYRMFLTPKGFGYEGPNNARLDPEWLHLRPPHDHFVSWQEGDVARSLRIDTGKRYQAEWTGDKNGFRNARTFDRAPIVLLGDSFIEGYKVPQESTCAACLSRALKADVCNLGQCDFGPYQELLALKRFGLPLRPRVAVWFFFEGNDLQDLEEYEEANRDWPSYAGRFSGYAHRSFFHIAAWRLDAWLTSFVRPDPDRVRQHEGLLNSTAADGPLTLYFGAPSFTIGERELALLAKTEKMLGQAKALCDAQHVRLLVAIVPLKQRVYRDLCHFANDAAPGIVTLNDLPRLFAECCRRQGLKCVDLTGALERAAERGVLVYYRDDEHWSPAGHAVVADEMAARIR